MEPPENPEEPKSGTDQEAGERIGLLVAKWIAPPLFVVILGGVILLVIITGLDLMPEKLPQDDDPDFIDNIFASRSVVFAVRSTIIVAAGYVLASLIALTFRRQWLTEVGPFKTTENVKELDATAESLLDALNDQIDANSQLEQRLHERDQELSAVWQKLDAAQAELDSFRDRTDT